MFANLQPFNNALAITTSDTVDLPLGLCDAVYVGGAGNIAGVLENGKAVTFSGALAGHVLPFKFSRINSTSTTATNLVALYRK
jgi:hypothetical protein